MVVIVSENEANSDKNASLSVFFYSLAMPLLKFFDCKFGKNFPWKLFQQLHGFTLSYSRPILTLPLTLFRPIFSFLEITTLKKHTHIYIYII